MLVALDCLPGMYAGRPHQLIFNKYIDHSRQPVKIINTLPHHLPREINICMDTGLVDSSL